MKFLYGKLQAFFAFLLNYIHGLVGNFGVAIILVTVIVRLLILPLTLKQDKSMKEMKKLQPILDDLKKKYAHDKQMLNIKTMELYKEHKVNPAGGCLPILIQLPILFALFGVLRSGIIPENETFLWLTLANPDPFYILPILNGVVTYAQQKIMGNNDNPQMQSMMTIMPFLIVFMSYKLPAGLQLYWFASSFISIIQQYFIMKRGV